MSVVVETDGTKKPNPELVFQDACIQLLKAGYQIRDCDLAFLAHSMGLPQRAAIDGLFNYLYSDEAEADESLTTDEFNPKLGRSGEYYYNTLGPQIVNSDEVEEEITEIVERLNPMHFTRQDPAEFLYVPPQTTHANAEIGIDADTQPTRRRKDWSRKKAKIVADLPNIQVASAADLRDRYSVPYWLAYDILKQHQGGTDVPHNGHSNSSPGRTLATAPAPSSSSEFGRKIKVSPELIEFAQNHDPRELFLRYPDIIVAQAMLAYGNTYTFPYLMKIKDNVERFGKTARFAGRSLSNLSSERFDTPLKQLTPIDVVDLFAAIAEVDGEISIEGIPFTQRLRAGKVPSDVLAAIAVLHPYYSREAHKTHNSSFQSYTLSEEGAGQKIHEKRITLAFFVQNMINQGRAAELFQLPDEATQQQKRSKMVLLQWLSLPQPQLAQNSSQAS